MGLTRGSRNDAVDPGSVRALRKGMRDWGKRHLSLSGDWFANRNREQQSRKKSVDLGLGEPLVKRSPPSESMSQL